MSEVAAQADRDQTIYRSWVDGASQADLAERYGITQSGVSRVIGRVQAALPPTVKEAEVLRTLDLVNDLVTVYAPKARAGNLAANREVRGLLALRGRFLGIDRREVMVEHGGTVEHVHTPGPTVEQVIEKWRAQGALTFPGDPALRGELTRTDQEPGS